MGMVEQAAYWDGIAGGGDDYDYDNVMDMLNVLDFPPECLEGDGDGDALIDDFDFDASKLGPIPSDALTGFLPVPQANIMQNNFSNAALKLKPSVDCVSQRTQNKYSDAQEAVMFQTQSPVSVLESSASCSGGKAIPVKTGVAVPVRTRTKRTRPSTNPWLLASLISSSTAFESRKTSAAKRRRERKLVQKSIVAVKDARNTNDALDAVVKKCTHCEVTKTPQWREGPMGPKTLCNACGVRYRSGRLFPEYRPAASPTFTPSLHSNSHRKVVEMRRKAVQGEAIVEESCKKVAEMSKKAFQESFTPPMSPLPEFVPMSNYLFDCI
ncbi:PREDICTED: GATA transcription factor 11-like [Ipomoea nil]|uniref:GATA transcription factor 11-like n=1 Tax=Ipomoea nil TaxID=35883 RepID=UPI000901BE99|nr:PREDICTED: GATA transcription factor 11-like [Ipomoea nil]